MHKNLKLFFTFLLAFCFIVSPIYALNETETNESHNLDSYFTSNETNTTEVLQVQDNSQYKELVNGNYLVIEDDAKLLNDNELILLREKMKPLTEYGNIIFKSVAVNDRDTYEYATDYYYKNFGNGSGTMLIIDMDPRNRWIYVVSEGWNYKIITKQKAEIITDNIYTYASRQQYYECASRAFDQIGTLLSGGKINEPMRHVSNIVLSLVTGFFISFIYVLQKSKIKAAKNSDILENCDISFVVKSIDVKSDGTHKVYSPRSSSSGGSGGAHSGGGGGFSGGGGGFSGGGGGHRF